MRTTKLRDECGAAEVHHRIVSAHLNNERSVWIREPLDKAKPSNLIVFLDAELYRDKVGAHTILHDLQAKGEVADSLSVFLSYGSLEARALECPCHPPFAAFVAEELLPWIWSRFPAAKDASTRILTGLSYTGLAASYVASLHPGAFTKIISQSGSYWSNHCWLVDQVGRMNGWIPPAFYLDVGLRETDAPVRHNPDLVQEVSQIDGVRAFRDALTAKGAQVMYVEFDGTHDFEAWKKTLPDALKWALPRASARPTEGVRPEWR
jgi:enterochelin esterase family protein